MPKKRVLLFQLTLYTEKSVANYNFFKKNIIQIIRNICLSKAHNGNDMISICMFKICLQNDRSPLEWKNVVPIDKAVNKQTTKIYLPVLLLPVYGKIFERLLCDTMFFKKTNISKKMKLIFIYFMGFLHQSASFN